ncbi:ImmA/IrrE family metallo-endopeptidase [Reichenbachiella sp.]|uniref:ImmA/IrrE family metallo-endopeptidase n=1 Tax=Reichenbachiella sp. TaxID=2184521 RepID=UPI003BAE4097
MNNRQATIEEFLNSIERDGLSLRQIFTNRLKDLDLSFTASKDIIGISPRALNGILDGTQKLIDITNLSRLSNFLQISEDEVYNLYRNAVNRNFATTANVDAQKAIFIRDHFDLANLRDSGFIPDINDYADIESRIVSYLNLDSIFDYKPIKNNAAFSSAKTKSKSELNKDYWIFAAIQVFKEIQNPNEYNRDALIEYFPKVRWHSTSIELGLLNVIRSLYDFGVTVVFLPTLKSLHLRGATISVNRKPCIVITNYRNFYATLWFALVHELFHVIFDWEEIKSQRYHLSEESSDVLTVVEKENEANDFTQEYLFSKEKIKRIRPNIYDDQAVESFARINHVHPSLIYAFNAFEAGNNNRSFWALAKKKNPDNELKKLLSTLDNSWQNPKPITEYVRSIKSKFYT